MMLNPASAGFLASRNKNIEEATMSAIIEAKICERH